MDTFGPSEQCPTCDETQSFGDFEECPRCGKTICFECKYSHECPDRFSDDFDRAMSILGETK
jgi:hypothetical protein